MASISVEQGVGMWLKKTAKSLSPRWADQIKRFTRHWIAAFGGKDMNDLTPAIMEKYEMERDDGRSGSSMNQERTYIRNFFKWARVMGHMVVVDPTAEWKVRKTDVRRDYAPPTEEEEAKLMAACTGKWGLWMQRYIQLSLYTGLRQGTIRQLTWDMVKGGYKLPFSMIRDAEKYPQDLGPEVIGRFGVLEVPGRIMKQKHPIRFPLVPKIKAALGPPGTGLIFQKLPDSPNLYQYFKRLVKRAGVNPDMSPHDLRRGWVQRLSDKGVPLQTIMSLGAWKTQGVLLKHYCGPVSMSRAEECLSLI